MSLLNQATRIYMIGLKGVGMTALAQHLLAQNKEVWGSDVAEDFVTTPVLKKLGLKIYDNFSAEHINGQIDLVIRSTAYGANNIEVQTAESKKIPILTYPEALGELTAGYQGIAVAGSHGKTTISAMLSHILKHTNLNPRAIVGSLVPQFGGNALIGSGDIFVYEADEYQNKFQYFLPRGIILTSVDWDHPDFFPTPNDYEAAFVNFLKKIPSDGFIVPCFDSPIVKKVVTEAGLQPEQIISYGLREGEWRLVRTWLDEGKWHFSVAHGEEFIGDFWLRLIGSHNVANAMAALACATKLGVDIEIIRQALASFEGTARRLEKKAKLINGVYLIDDYAHHPAEIKASLKALRAFYPYKKIRCVFQPHTFTRTKALLPDFATAFAEADEVVMMDIYGSAREEQGGISAEDVVAEIKKHHQNVVYQPKIDNALEYLISTASKSDLVITMGAGDVWQVGEKMIEKVGKVEEV